MYYLVLNSLPRTTETFNDHGRNFSVDEQQYWQARAASIGALLGIVFLGWAPFFLWKAHVRALLSIRPQVDAHCHPWMCIG